MGSSRGSLWNRRRIGLLLLAVIVLPLLPILGSKRDATPTRWARGVGDAQSLAFAFAADGETIATVQMDRRVALRDATGGGGITDFLDYPSCAGAVAYSPDGRLLATASGDGIVRLWSLATGAKLRQVGGSAERLVGVAFAPDGKMLAATGYDNDIRFWDLAELFGESKAAAFPTSYIPDSDDGWTWDREEHWSRYLAS
jgi:WD40 repeat protein